MIRRTGGHAGLPMRASQGSPLKSILIVEDHADIRQLIRMTLEFDDFDVHEAVDGPSGLAAAAALRPDVLLLDVMMPGGIDGLEVCRRVRADPLLAHTRVLLLSARGKLQDRERGLQAGADAYMVKPFSPMELLQVIADVLKAVPGGAGPAG